VAASLRSVGPIRVGRIGDGRQFSADGIERDLELADRAAIHGARLGERVALVTMTDLEAALWTGPRHRRTQRPIDTTLNRKKSNRATTKCQRLFTGVCEPDNDPGGYEISMSAREAKPSRWSLYAVANLKNRAAGVESRRFTDQLPTAVARLPWGLLESAPI